ncbi:MAG: PspA/IM30 family protein [Pseudomonadota bacterium]
MAEGLAGRVGRIVAGSLNSLVDALEGSAPDVVFNQALREIDEATDDTRAELGKVIARRHLASKRLTEKNQAHEDLAEKITLAVSEGRDDLAEAAIAKQLDIEAQIPILEHEIAECGDEEKALEGYISALGAKKRDMQDELKSLNAAQASADRPSGGGGVKDTGSSDIENRVRNATSAFDRAMEAQSGLAGGDKPDMANEAKIAELEDMALKNRIKERLAKVKSASET